ncbi:MAG TPA: amino acid adenylation domain-containing protein, partial [Thermoanaerobaculia bacterium]|nr:amino acid adenylation domain-containing protein [Thermoanaerobaculia bacterium]
MSVEHEPALARADQVVAGFRLSPQQRRLWNLGGGDAASPYRASCAVAIRGPLEVTALAAAIGGAVERHEILRTTFRSLAEVKVPLQVIGTHPPSLEPVPELDGGGAAAVAALAEGLRRQPLDVGRGPLVHGRLAALAEGEWGLVLALPGLCADAAGLRILVREVAAGYGACVEGPQLTAEPLQYADLSEWQNGLLEEGEADQWRRRVGSCTPPSLPFARAAGRGRFEPRVLAVALDAAEGERIVELARANGASPRAFLLACWQLLIGRVSGRSEMLLGVVDDGRSYEGLDRALGPFAKHLPLVCGAEPNTRFADLLRRAEADLADLRQWQEYYDPDQGGTPEAPAYLPVCFAWEEELPPLVAGGVTFAVPTVEAWIERFDLALVVRRAEALGLELQYDAAACRPEDVARLADQLRALVSSALEAPDAAAGELVGISAAERHRLVVELNRTEAERTPARGIHELFARQARTVPERPALRYEDRELTYGELAGRVHRLARRLRRLGVGPETPVAVCCERSLEIVVSILGVLEAGGAYVPLDPGQPAARLRAMLDEVGAKVLLTQERLAAKLPSQGAGVLRLDADWGEIATESDRTPPPVGEPENLAYVIFTSGSTGRPKGVGVEHRQLLNYVTGAVEALDLAAASSFATVSTFAADLGHTAVFPALCLGGCLHVVSQERLSDPTAAGDYFARHPVDCLKIVPSHLEALLGCANPGKVLPRKRLVLGGEPCRRGLVEKIRALAPECAQFNHYGPTETTVGVLVHSLAGDGVSGGDLTETSVPLGRPLGNTRVYVLDASLRPLPVWVAGEIYIGGAGVARGYVGRPDATAERFVPDPFSPGARLYRTGDRGRFLPSGEVEFLGRADDQVKIRGFRIEPGEVEALLRAHPAVAQAVVAAREDAAGEKRLVAYVVPAEGSRPVAGELRDWLGERLPEYMIPAALVELESLPLGPNGKVDRAALPAPTTATAAVAYEPPRSPVEELLADIWATVLGMERIGIHDHFFALGGHSLLATQVISRVRHALGREVPLRLLFEAPILARFAAGVAERAGSRAALPPVEARPRGGELPLSLAQQRLWFLDQLQPGSSLYNIPAAFRLSGDLDQGALARSLNEIVRRHESLRTTFPAIQGRPVQRIDAPAPGALPLVDLSALRETRPDAEAFRVAAAEARRPFDLARGPLRRTALLRLAAREHVLLATLHHIVADGWSRGILVRELGALYPAFASGRPTPLPDLSVQYADFAQWQRQWLEGEALDGQLAYWRRRLAGAPPVLVLPADRPRPAAPSHAGGHLHFALAAPLAEGLRRLGRNEGATLFMTLLAALQVLLARLSGQEDISIGTAVSGRNRLEIEGLIGFFVNTLVLRGDVRGEPTFRELLGRARGEVLEAYARQDLPFERLVEELEPERSLAYNPLFQVMLVLHNAPREKLELAGLTLSALPVESGAAKFDLALPLLESDQGLAGAVEYASELFDVSTVRRWLGSFEALLAEVVRAPETPMGRLPLLTPAERQQLLVEWQAAAETEGLGAAGLHELFEAQVRSVPERTALEVGERSLTYGELNARANVLARRLVRLGIGAEAVVAVALERSVEAVVALLAVLKAGGAYLPVDPGYPAERVEYLLRDAGAAAVVGRRELAAALPAGGAPWVSPVVGEGDLSGEETADLRRPVTAGQLAYVIYTSGSTGLPKGVGIAHETAARHLAAMSHAFGIRAEDRVLQFAALSFDVSLEQLFSALLAGAALVMRSEEPWGEAELFAQLARAEVTVANLPTAFWQQVTRSKGLVERLRRTRLRLMIAGGEAMVGEGSGAWAPVRLLNAYGPTEATITATLFEVRGDWAGRRVPIGRPVGERTAYVLDRWGEPAPIGVAGELCLGGPLLARGYVGRPELTAERFVPDPFCSAGGRLYRTGDIVRVLPGGALEFLGRHDDQVKVRGFRIELGEVEAALASCPGVGEAAVAAWAEGPADKRLVAYVVARDGTPLDLSKLRRHLARALPEFMRPSVFVLLDALPLTPTGKVDRKALPLPEQHAPEPAAIALTPTEELVAAVWSQVLGTQEVARDASFFDMGGHSLLAVQVISRLRELFQLELPLRSLFEAPTVAGIARAIEELRGSAQKAQMPPLGPVLRDGPLPLSFAQQRFWFLHQLQAGSAAYNLPVAFRVAGALDASVIAHSLGEIVRRHEVLRTTFGVEGGELVQVIAPPAAARSLPLLDLAGLESEVRESEAERLAITMARRRFDLERGPLLRAALVRLVAAEHVVVAVMHHSVADGWSIGALLRELAALYRAYAGGRSSPLPELPVQYADFAVWQRHWLAGEVLESEVRHWRERLADLRTLELPLDRPRPPVQTFRGGREPLRLPPRLRDACAALARAEAATLFMTLVAGWSALLARSTGSTDVPLGTPVANRDRAELEGLIGLFLNTLVLRLDLSGDPTTSELIRRVREVALEAFAHQHLPFEKLVEELQPERDLSRTPFFQTLFVLQGDPHGVLELPGLTASPFTLHDGSAKFDLSLSMQRSIQGLVGALDYRRDLFDAATIRRMARHFAALLEGMTADPGRPLSQLPVLSEAERHQVEVEWSEGWEAGAGEALVHERVAAQAARRAEALA